MATLEEIREFLRQTGPINIILSLTTYQQILKYSVLNIICCQNNTVVSKLDNIAKYGFTCCSLLLLKLLLLLLLLLFPLTSCHSTT